MYFSKEGRAFLVFMLRYIQCKYQNKKNNPASQLCSVVLLVFSTGSLCYSPGRRVFHRVVVAFFTPLPCSPPIHHLHPVAGLSAVGFYRLSLGYAFHHWVPPFVVIGLCPSSSLGSPLHHWAMPSAIGFHPSSSLGYALRRRWVLPSVVGLCPSPLGSPLRHRWAMPFFIFGFSPPLSLGYAFRRWVLPSVVAFMHPPSSSSCRLLLFLIVVSSPPPPPRVISSFSSSCCLLRFLFLLLFLLFLLLLLCSSSSSSSASCRVCVVSFTVLAMHRMVIVCHPHHVVVRPVRRPRRLSLPPITPSSANEQAAHIWKGRGGCGCFEWAGSVSDWAHIPQERGGHHAV